MSESSRLHRARNSATVRTLAKYSTVSVIALGVSELTLVGLFGLAGWSATTANIVACVTGGVPSYVLNRRWVWQRTGRSHLRNEVLPFWVLAFVGLAVTTSVAYVAENWSETQVDSHFWRTAVVATAALGGAFIVWIGKFVAFNAFVFRRDTDS